MAVTFAMDLKFVAVDKPDGYSRPKAKELLDSYVGTDAVSYTHLDVYKRQPQNGWKPFEECKGRRELDCDTDGWSRYESRT